MSHFNVAVFSRHPSDVDVLLEPFQENVEPGSDYSSFEEDDDYDVDPITGERGYWFNPDARWDWYEVGGRWKDELRLLPGRVGEYGERSRCDCALVNDCDFRVDNAARQKALRFWEVAVEGKPLEDGESGEDFQTCYQPQYYIDQYGTKDNYARYQSVFKPYAFVTADGEWCETGHMGWFGCDDATAESRERYSREFEEYLKVAKAERLYVTMVDCHI